ncbi:MAG: oxidoreductase, Fe-S subunit [Promethearchaeota archaeon]|nr:MAG: oxidoreductase, Fe-S subunit [Candidatus Lokiarchaeota archaeon]
MTQLGFFIDQTRCTGCYTCYVACKDWYDLSAGLDGFLKIKKIEKGTFPNLFLAYLPMMCNHCHDPPCIKACPVEALTKREKDGIVIVDSEKCLGNEKCDTKCLKVCPYDAPQFGLENGAKMNKCNLCVERLDQDKEPICVEACPMYAIKIGDVKELKEKFECKSRTEGFVYHENYKPSICFKPKESTLQENK